MLKHPKNICYCLLTIDVFHVVAYLFTRAVFLPGLGVRDLFDLDREQSIPTWFSSIQLFFAAMIAFSKTQSKSEHFHSLFRAATYGLLFLSMDEVAGIHETITAFIRHFKIGFSGREYLIWMFGYLTIATVIALKEIYPVLFVLKYYRRESMVVIAGTVVFISGGMGIEIITHILARHGFDLGFYLAVAAEEFFEMVGVSIVTYGLMLFDDEKEQNAAKLWNNG